MKELSAREFRDQWVGLTEPVKVMSRGRLVGTFYPVGTEVEAPVVTTPRSTTAPSKDVPFFRPYSKAEQAGKKK